MNRVWWSLLIVVAIITIACLVVWTFEGVTVHHFLNGQGTK